MSLQNHLITEKQVILDFDKYINDFCENYHLGSGKPRPMICTIMIDLLHGKVEGGKSDDWMRRRIDSKYKMTYRVNNVNQKKISKIDKLKEKFKKVEAELLQATHELSIKAKQDF